MSSEKRAALYARFSSEMQRTESIDAQLRAMHEYCEQHHWTVSAEYVDEAKSAMTDRRPAFQSMIADSAKHLFDIVLVLKLDRFCRNRYDSAKYRYKLRKNGVLLCSVLEKLDDSPESIIMESVLEGMAEYYSKNLGRELMKTKLVNARHCKNNGGMLPLGYDLDADGHLIINQHEAEAVRMIFEMYANGYGLKQIADTLNDLGYRSKIGRPFSSGSFNEIFRNEKYIGVFVYNKALPADINHHRNTYRHKSDDQIIRIPNGCPAIITKELFERVQIMRRQNHGSAGRFHAKSFYLCSGIVFCGCCESKMVGSTRKGHEQQSAYVCRSKQSECKNRKSVNRDALDAYAVELLEKELLNSYSLRLRITNLSMQTGQQIVYEEYESLLAEYEKLPPGTPQFRLFVQRYLKRVTVYPKSIRFTVDFGFGIAELSKVYSADRKRFYKRRTA